MQCLVFSAAGATARIDCARLGEENEISQHQGAAYGAIWAVEAGNATGLLNGVGPDSHVTLWSASGLTRLGLGSLTTPVGAVYHRGLLYVACFGTDSGDSGLAIIDVHAGKLRSTHAFPQRMYVHNAHVFKIDGQDQIFVSVLGNPWSSPPVAGLGLIRFINGEFEVHANIRLNARSAKQQSDGAIFVLTQEPPGVRTKLARLEPFGGHLRVVATTQLPERSHGGEGGADVVLGLHRDTVWVTDRQDAAPGKLHFYRYISSGFSKLATRDVGIRPRYLTVLTNGDIVSCNQDGGDLSVFAGLARRPLDDTIAELRIKSIASPMFLLQTVLEDQSMILV